MSIDHTLPPRSHGMLRDVSLFPFDAAEQVPALIAQKMLHQSEQPGGERVIAAKLLDPTRKRHLEETAGSTFRKKMRKEERSSAQENFADQFNPGSKPRVARKKREIVRCLKPFFSGRRLEFSKNTCDLARRAFLRALISESTKAENGRWFTNNVYVVASGMLDAQKRHFLEVQVQEKHPTASVFFKWVDIPHGCFYTANNFQKMEDALYEIPFHSRIFIHEGNRLICGKGQKKGAVKKPRPFLADKVIVFDPEGSSVIFDLFKNFQKQSSVTHYYITTGSSFEPLKDLTERSRVYFSNGDKLVQQSPKMLAARGFRVIHSLKNKNRSESTTPESSVVLNRD